MAAGALLVIMQQEQQRKEQKEREERTKQFNEGMAKLQGSTSSSTTMTSTYSVNNLKTFS